METKKQKISQPVLGMKVYHKDIYNGNELMEIVGIRKDTIELQGDYSGGTNAIVQADWLPIKGTFKVKKICDRVVKYGTCDLPNVHCGYPGCEPFID
jgi:hypothetical protein